MSEISVKELSEDIRQAIEDLKTSPEIENVGVVTRSADGIAWIYGLRSCGANEVVEIEANDGGSVQAFALNLQENEICKFCFYFADRGSGRFGRLRSSGRSETARPAIGHVEDR